MRWWRVPLRATVGRVGIVLMLGAAGCAKAVVLGEANGADVRPSGDCSDGRGAASLIFGGQPARYEGGLVGGLAHGQGRIIGSATGRLLYQGTFEHGEATGVATTLELPGGSCAGDVKRGLPHGQASCHYVGFAHTSRKPMLIYYSGAFVDGRPSGSGTGTLQVDLLTVVFTGRWDGGPREGVLTGELAGAIEFDAEGRIIRDDAGVTAALAAASPPVAAGPPAAHVEVASFRMEDLDLAGLGADAGCLAGSCVDGEGVLAVDDSTVVRATFVSGHPAIIHERVARVTYERGAFPVGWLHGEGKRVWRSRTPRVEEGWFVAGEFVGDRAAFEAALITSPAVVLQAAVVGARAASAAAASAQEALVTYVETLPIQRAVPVAQRATLAALVQSARAAALVSRDAWDVPLPTGVREFSPLLALHHDVFAGDVVAYDAFIAAARIASESRSDGRELASMLRRSLEVLVQGRAAYVRARDFLNAALDKYWWHAQIETAKRLVEARRAAAAAGDAATR